MDEAYFYNNLTPTEDLDALSTHDQYHLLPKDWYVIITDVVGSTKAIKEGRYRAVNMVGAATIAVVKNIAGAIEFPFQFGGDGASLCIPPNLKPQAAHALRCLLAHSERIYGLSLRAGIFSVERLCNEGGDVRVQKYCLSPNNAICHFAGDGLALAEHWLKHPPSIERSDDEAILLLETPEQLNEQESPDLQGLSCRWAPLKSQQGVMMTLMIKPLETDADQQAQALRYILGELAKLLGNHPVTDFSPVHQNNLHLSQSSPYHDMETRAMLNGIKFKIPGIYTLFRSFLSIKMLLMRLCIKQHVNMGTMDTMRYLEDVEKNSDHVKYDGILRMVLDLSKIQAEKIEAWLEAGWQQRQFIYGIHCSENALMTCLVQDMSAFRHIHFIDGADGGFALASVPFKERLALLKAD